jgi:hypothetical protein
VLLLAGSVAAETVRVTAWNLQAATGAALGSNQLGAAGALLQRLDSDVLLLQGVRDWQMCAQLAETLKPANYNVLVCSSFRERRTGAPSATQVAILAKSKAYFSWAESWQSSTTASGGFAFVALQVAGQRVGWFSLQAGGSSGEARLGRECLDQLQAQVGTVKHWVTNQVGTWVIGGAFRPEGLGNSQGRLLELLQRADFVNALADSSPGSAAEVAPGRAGEPEEHILIQPKAFASRPQVLAAEGFAYRPVTCELELDPAVAAAARARQLAESEQRAAQAAKTQAARLVEGSLPGTAQANGSTTVLPVPPKPGATSTRLGSMMPWWLPLLVGGLLGLSGLVWAVAARTTPKRERQPFLISYPAQADPAAGASYTIVIAPRSATGPASQDTTAPSGAAAIINLGPPGETKTRVAGWLSALPGEAEGQANALLRQGLIQNVSHWLKATLVRKLLLDRTRQLQVQQAATDKARNVDQRLARLELQVQLKSQSYEQRIEELTTELLAAKEENRELIRAQILRLKSEMEAARARVGAQHDPKHHLP